MRNYGDLWNHLHHIFFRAGSKSVKCSWVKCHAIQLHIFRGITTQISKEGNDKAVEVADMGTALHGKDTIDAAEWLKNSHASYTNLMVDMVKKNDRELQYTWNAHHEI